MRSIVGEDTKDGLILVFLSENFIYWRCKRAKISIGFYWKTFI